MSAIGWRPCPHGDRACPCQDVGPDGVRDLCNYEGEDPAPCPLTGIVGCTECRGSAWPLSERMGDPDAA